MHAWQFVPATVLAAMLLSGNFSVTIGAARITGHLRAGGGASSSARASRDGCSGRGSWQARWIGRSRRSDARHGCINAGAAAGAARPAGRASRRRRSS